MANFAHTGRYLYDFLLLGTILFLQIKAPFKQTVMPHLSHAKQQLTVGGDWPVLFGSQCFRFICHGTQLCHLG